MFKSEIQEVGTVELPKFSGVRVMMLPSITSVVPLVMVVVSIVRPVAIVAHVASPRQKWLLSAFVPELRLATGRLPVTSVARLIGTTCVRTNVAIWVPVTPADSLWNPTFIVVMLFVSLMYFEWALP